MQLSLDPATTTLLEQQLKSGKYATAEQVVHAALEALREVDSLALDDEALDAIDRAEDQIERGEYRDWNDVREQVRNKILGK